MEPTSGQIIRVRPSETIPILRAASTTTLQMTDVKQMLESLIEQKKSLEKTIKLLRDSTKFPIPTNQYTWDPSNDTLWIFEMRGVGNVEESDLVSSFCHNKFFRDFNDSSGEIIILPIGLYDFTQGMRDITGQTLKCLETYFKNKDWWDDEKCFVASNFNKKLDKIVEVISPGAIIFRGGHIDALPVIEKLLRNLRVSVGHIDPNVTAPALDFDVLWKMTHFNLFDERVTIFKYD
uniref:Uncharacterized protein n=1 Tax=Pithovirus LCPAC202 TaxID=2506592 RepID=A0A481Z8R5_9VIRU|nr:MAG: hypothetical protein LCPAC202_00450 [Pithovirus LCPAC202]